MLLFIQEGIFLGFSSPFRLFDKAEIKLLDFKLHMIQQWLPLCDCPFVPSRTCCIF